MKIYHNLRFVPERSLYQGAQVPYWPQRLLYFFGLRKPLLTPSPFNPSSRLSDPRFFLLILLCLFLWMFFVEFMREARSIAAEPLSQEFGVLQKSSTLLEEIQFLQEEQVSIASQHLQPISEAPGNVYVITDEDIRQSGAIDLPTILRRVPGMEVIQMNGVDFDVSARGDNQPRANKLLVLVDGRSIYLDVQGEVLWKAIPVTLPEIKRIEVMKGPASSLYGFNAFDGVVNIITKSPEEMKGATVQFGGGEFGTITSSAIFAGATEKLGYRLSYGHEENTLFEDRDSLAFRINKFNGQIEYALPAEAKLKASGGFYSSNRFKGPLVDLVNISQEPQQGYVNASYERPDFFLRLWWTNLDQPSVIGLDPRVSPFFSIIDPNGNPKQNLTWNSYNVEGQHALTLGTANRLTYGFNYRHNSVSSNFLFSDAVENRLGLYLQDEWNLTSTLSAVASIRLDMDTFINPTYSPRLSLLYKPYPNHSFRATGSLAYRPPTIFERKTNSRGSFFFPGFPPFVPPSTTTTSLTGSKDLSPEQIISFEAGYQGWYLRHRLRTRFDFFYDHISDLIFQFPQIPPNLTLINGGEIDIYGLEAGLEFLATPWLTGFTNYAFQQIQQTLPNNGRLGRRAGPRFKINVGLRGEWDFGLRVEATLHHVGQARYPVNSAFTTVSTLPGGSPPPDTLVGSYNLLNLRAAYSFWKENGKDRAEVAITTFNALNDKHREHPLGETIKRRVMAWLTLRFD